MSFGPALRPIEAVCSWSCWRGQVGVSVGAVVAGVDGVVMVVRRGGGGGGDVNGGE
jgi:uncharacterized membrane protein